MVREAREKGKGLTVKEDEGQEGGGSHDDGPGSTHANAQPQLVHAVAEAELVHDRLAYGVTRVVRVRLLPPLCTRARALLIAGTLLSRISDAIEFTGSCVCNL